MAGFDAAVPTVPVSVWRDADRIRDLPPFDLGTPDHLVVVAAHPDDETLGLGGLLHAAAARGIRAHIVVVTDGAASHPDSPTTTPTQLAVRRHGEAMQAAVRVGRASLTWVGLPDGAIDGRRNAVREAVADVVADLDGTVVLAAPWRADRHRDHRVVGEECVALGTQDPRVRVIEYPVWLRHWGRPDDDAIDWSRFRRVELSVADVAAKRAALDAYVSQTTPLSGAPGDEAVLRPAFLEHAAVPVELVVVSESEPGAPAIASRSADTPTVSDTDPAYFDDLYARHDDPWGYASRWYERRKRALSLAVLRRERYGRVLELGCSTGVLAEELAARADSLVAVDGAEAAVERARARLEGIPGVEVHRADLRDPLPEGPFDLVVLSETGYYLGARSLDALGARIRSRLSPDGEVLACHWRHPSSTFASDAGAVHYALAGAFGLPHVHHEEPDLVLDLFVMDGRSVAQREGLA